MIAMRIYLIPLVWQMYGKVEVEAASLREAIDYALGPECPLPEGDYLDESVVVDEDLLALECPELVEEYHDFKQAKGAETTMVERRS